MKEETVQSQYDAFAPDYHWLFSERVLAGEPFYERYRELLESLSPEATILDCACGVGIQALALARHGYRVRGTDGSAGMIARAKKRARQAELPVAFERCSWEELPEKLSERFDLAMCCGNAIGHCRDEDEMVRSLRGIRGALKDGGVLVIDSRNWEKLHAERPRFQALSAREKNGVRCIPVYVWNFHAERGDPIIIEVVLVFEGDDKTYCRCHSFTYYPFRVEELIARLKAAGFTDVETDYSETKDLYSVTARRKSQ